MFNIHIHKGKRELKKILSQLNLIQNQMAKTQAETAQELRDIKEQNEKARTEIVAKIAALEEALKNSGNTSDEVDAAVQDLKASVQTDDDMNPDTPPTV